MLKCAKIVVMKESKLLDSTSVFLMLYVYTGCCVPNTNPISFFLKLGVIGVLGAAMQLCRKSCFHRDIVINLLFALL